MTGGICPSTGSRGSSCCGAGEARGRWRGNSSRRSSPSIDDFDLCGPAGERHFTALFLVLMLLAGCSDPTDPVPTSGIIVFARADYGGPYRTFVDDVLDLKRVEDKPQPDAEDCADKFFGQERWTDCISSIRVADGWQAVVYRHDTFRGDSLTVTFDIPDLSQIQLQSSPDEARAPWSWDDQISSIRVWR